MGRDVQFRNRIPGSGGAWVTFPFAANYQAFGAPWQAPQYRIVGDIVYLRGLLTRNTSNAPAGSVCGTMPVGACPPAQLFFEGLNSGVREMIQVNANGQILHTTVALVVATGYLALDGIFYSTTA